MNKLFDCVYVENLEGMKEFMQGYSNNYSKAVVVVLKKDIFKDKINVYEREQVCNFIIAQSGLMILVLDCELSEDNIQFIFSFDMCFALENAKLILLHKSEKLGRIIQFMIGNKNIELLYSKAYADSMDMYKLGIITKILISDNIEEEIKDNICQIVQERNETQIASIKKVYNSYKMMILNDNDVYGDIYNSVKPEMETFCKLALMKYKEHI